ncbi:MAG: acyl transferase, partial [Ekhidna sp.]|nr:acyl transferase [Ekhidna sp.]
MSFSEDFKSSIFNINAKNFEDSSLAVFDYQYHQCDIYQKYCNFLKRKPSEVKSILEIPFLPIEFFKYHQVKSGNWKEQVIFKSSGTTKTGRSTHHVRDTAFYHSVAAHIFKRHFGSTQDLKIIALLPSYLEQGDSSLISMVDHFISKSKSPSGFYSAEEIEGLTISNDKCILIGVAYALLDLARKGISVTGSQIIETGGMKGRGKEITRNELHSSIRNGLSVDTVWSEYGMTELMSQAYGQNGRLTFPAWASVLIRDANDPFSYLGEGKTGGVNVIDLANIDSCSFIETKDLGRAKGQEFEILGRFDNSDIRGCNQ